MVKICSLTYPKESEPQYKQYYDKFSYELHDFQKWAIEALVNGHHVLITAPTGTGKSMPAEFALDFFHSKNKKTIYCSPIKSLSNQKYYDFTKKYPHISVGIITGDIKANPDADVLIMTTEILLNKLYQLKSKSITATQVASQTTTTSFDMDIENELGCVIFDEFHMIGDRDRGHVWENSVIMLPTHIQIIGLSATLDNPEKFASWIETRGITNVVPEKMVYFAKKSMIQDEIENDIKNYNKDLVKIQDELEKSNMVMASCKAPVPIIIEYMDLKNKQITSFNKKRRDAERAMEAIVEKYYNIEKDVEIYKRHNSKCMEKDTICDKIVRTEKSIDNSVNCVLDLLEKWNVISKSNNNKQTNQTIYQLISSALKSESDADANINTNTDTYTYELTLNGHVAKQLREVHCIVFSDLIIKNRFKTMTTVELIGVFSCFTNVSVSVEQRSAFPVSKNTDVKNCISEICEMYTVYREIEAKNNIDTGIDYSIHFDLTDYMMEWCECQNEQECKQLLQKIFEEKGILLGEFIKAVLKINNISAELEKVAETMCDIEFLDKLKRIPELTMKFVATNQSLYV